MPSFIVYGEGIPRWVQRVLVLLGGSIYYPAAEAGRHSCCRVPLPEGTRSVSISTSTHGGYQGGNGDVDPTILPSGQSVVPPLAGDSEDRDFILVVGRGSGRFVVPPIPVPKVLAGIVSEQSVSPLLSILAIRVPLETFSLAPKGKRFTARSGGGNYHYEGRKVAVDLVYRLLDEPAPVGAPTLRIEKAPAS